VVTSLRGGVATGPLPYASKWRRDAKQDTLACNEDIAQAYGETSLDSPEYSPDHYEELMHRSMPHMETFHLQPRSIRTRSMTSCDAEYDMDECEGAEASGAKLLASLLDLPFAVVSPTMPRSSEEATCDPTAVEHPVAHS
jgi:hypothetical protein